VEHIPRLEPGPRPLYSRHTNRSFPMLAIAIILGFVAVMALINFVEFGRVD